MHQASSCPRTALKRPRKSSPPRQAGLTRIFHLAPKPYIIGSTGTLLSPPRLTKIRTAESSESLRTSDLVHATTSKESRQRVAFSMPSVRFHSLGPMSRGVSALRFSAKISPSCLPTPNSPLIYPCIWRGMIALQAMCWIDPSSTHSKNCC